MILKRSVLNSRNLEFNEISFNLFADIQVRSQKFAMRGLFWGSGGTAPSARKFCIFLQNNLILGLLVKNSAIKTWHKKLAAQHDLTDCINGRCGRWLMITL